MWYIYTMNISHWKEWNNAICSNVDELRDFHTEWSISEVKCCMAFLICEIQKEMIQMDLFTKQAPRLREWTYGCQGGTVSGGDS